MTKHTLSPLVLLCLLAFATTATASVNQTNQSVPNPEPENQLWKITWKIEPISQTNVSCEFCEVIVALIDHDIKEANETFTVIEEFVEVLCKVINPVVEPACEAILKDLKEIFDWIVNGTYPTNEICQKLGLCPG